MGRPPGPGTLPPLGGMAMGFFAHIARAGGVRPGRGMARDQGGQAAVEMCLILPFLVVIILLVVQVFLAADTTIVTLVEARRRTTEAAQQVDGGSWFGFIQQEATNEMPVLPGLDGLFRGITGTGLVRPSGQPWTTTRWAGVYAGPMTGTRMSVFNEQGDGQGLGGRAARQDAMRTHFGN